MQCRGSPGPVLSAVYPQQQFGGDCHLCRRGARQVQARLAASSPEAVAAKLVEVCGQLGSYSTACMLTVQQQSEASVVVDIYCRYSI